MDLHTPEVKRYEQKRVGFLLALQKHGESFVSVNLRMASGAVVPPQFRKQASVVMRWTPTTDDLRIDESGLSGWLIFGGERFAVFLPWACLYEISCGRESAYVWTIDAPKAFTGDVVSGATLFAHACNHKRSAN